MRYCETCKVWQTKKAELLDTCDSVFDAVASLTEFEKECAASCIYESHNSDG